MSDLIDFYKRTVRSLGLTVTTDNFLKIGSGTEKRMLTTNGKSLVLPTKEHLATLLSDEDGKIVVNKIPYNPLNENIIKGDSMSLNKTKELVEYRLTLGVASAGSLLMGLAKNPKLQTKTASMLNAFLIGLTEVKTAKVPVDDKSIENWEKLIAAGNNNNVPVCKIYLKRSGVKEGTKYNRLATIKFPLYNLLMESEKNESVLGVKIRPKDLIVYRLIMRFLIEDLEESTTVSVGSNDGESSGFISLFRLYLMLTKKMLKVIDNLKDIDAATYDVGHVKIHVKDAELDRLSLFKTELGTIPNELDLNRAKTTAATAAPVTPATVLQTQPTQQLVNVNNTPVINNVQSQVMAEPVQQQSTERDLFNKVLYGGGLNTVTPVIKVSDMRQQQQPQMVLPQSGMVNMGQQAIPGGVNTLPITGLAGQQQQQMVLPQNVMGMTMSQIPQQQYPQMQQQGGFMGYPNNNGMYPQMQQTPMGL